MHQIRSSIGDPMTMKPLVEISDRYSSKGKSSGSRHPYTIENASSKKSFKKKTESIDM